MFEHAQETMKRSVIEKYLSTYAEPETAELPPLSGRHSHAVVVPVHREGPAFLGTLRSVSRAAAKSGASPVIVIVINGREGDEPAYAANRDLFEALSMDEGPAGPSNGPWVAHSFEGLSLLICRRFEGTGAFGAKDGVGRARKIGTDAALAYVASGEITSPWIRSTDADVTVPEDYLVDPTRAGAAFTLPFRHAPTHLALQLYEISLRYYVLGLHWAGSSYAFHTIGSTLGIHADAYAKVRGFPRRLAGEDFYLLNKLAKVGPVFSLPRHPLSIAGRPSDRVPFGTGPATAKIAARLEAKQGFTLYDPRSFDTLREVNRSLSQVARGRTLLPLKEACQGFDPGWRSLERVLDQGSSESVLMRQLVGHFDAFRTLKLIHHARANRWPPLDWRCALERARFTLLATRDPAEALAALIAREIALEP